MTAPVVRVSRTGDGWTARATVPHGTDPTPVAHAGLDATTTEPHHTWITRPHAAPAQVGLTYPHRPAATAAARAMAAALNTEVQP